MRNAFYIVLLLTAVIAGCGQGKRKAATNAIGVIRDETDTAFAAIQEAEVMSLYGMTDERVMEGYYFRISYIGEAENRDAVEYRVGSEDWLWASQTERVGRLREFQRLVAECIGRTNKEAVQPKKYSRCYQSICKEMEALAESGADTKTLLVFSDLYHNDENFSVYDKSQYELARAHPKDAASLLEAIRPMPKVPGLRVFVIYKPRNYMDQLRFETASRVFAHLWKQQGAEVVIGPNVIHHGTAGD